jgi:hypothetical protein
MDTFRAAAAAALAAALAAAGCGEPVVSTEPLPAAAPASADPTAGSWKMIVLTSPTQIAVPPPEPVSSDAYRAELALVKDAQRQLTAEQREVIQFWSGGAILRWNQILRELVARFNLPPAPSADGTYPAPNAANPFADPQFPFSNPPYAARAYSYVSVAQYEALKSAWFYMHDYRRPSPFRVDSGVQSLMPDAGLPAYPSHDAVTAEVSAAMLRLLFPAAVDEIDQHAADHRNAALWSGRAAPSDIAAGQALGRSVAAVLTARAATDGMRTAGGNRAVWDAMAAQAQARGEIPWASLESPPRPPMLPLFGQVRAWSMTPADIVAERPGPPPSTGSAQMQQELAEVKSYADATREQLAIAHKWSDGGGTYTPPGHWNDIAADHVLEARMSEVRAARAFALLNMSMHDAAVGCWDAKYSYFNPRPSQLDPDIKTAIGLPNFPSYTSGHSTFSASAAHVLAYLFPAHQADFDAMKEEAAISRLYGCIHYRSDIEVGKDHGKRIGEYTVKFARGDGAN